MRTDELSDPEISICDLLPARTADTAVRADDGVERTLEGERFGRYLIVGELAMGGMAEIFLGVQSGLEGFTKVVVIKRVLPQFGCNPEFVRMFIDEARLAARLEHPNIVRTYEFGEVAGQYFTTMEYLPGEDLSKTLNNLAASKQAMPLHIAAGIVARVCAGLQFAHQLTDTAGRPLSLVHRDINPANIILTYGGEVKIIDFGVAKTSETHTVAGTIKGKIAYMSPEQLLGRGIDHRSDVFSAGIVLWELLTGRPLFHRDSEAATLYAIMNDPIRMAGRYRADVPPELDRIVARALSRTPADRYDSAEEMANALDAFLVSQQKCDARALGHILEELFGSTRAEAKRSIAQTRSLGRNVSLVMKLRSEVRAEFSERLDSIAVGSDVGDSATYPEASPRPRSRAPAVACAALALGCLGGGILYLFGSQADSGGLAAAAPLTHGSVQVDSTPRGAAITLGGEPTGLTTPAKLTGISSDHVTIRLALPDHQTVSASLDLPLGGTITKHFTLRPTATSRLVVSDLPPSAIVIVDGESHPAGETIEVVVGAHDVRVVLNGHTVAQQQIETTPGLHDWKLADRRLVHR